MSSDGVGIWEAGPEIWPHIRCVPFARTRVPVVPLEIQLETSIVRGMQERTAAILAALRHNGYDHSLIQKALHSDHLEKSEAMMKGLADRP